MPDKIDWAVVFATLVGPILAVLVTLWAQARDNRRRNRMELFSNMMRSRRNPTAIEFVGSLNLVPVHFHADRQVIAKYGELIALFEDSAWRSKDLEAIRRINDKVETSTAYLLSAMSKALGVPIEQLAILKGAYAPQGWADEEQEQKGLRLDLRRVLTGERPLVVLPLDPRPAHPTKSEGTPEDAAKIDAPQSVPMPANGTGGGDVVP